MGIMSAVKALVTSDGIVEKGAAAIDALHLSKEEEAGLNEKYILAKAKLLEASGPSAITRRILAIVASLMSAIFNLTWFLCWIIDTFTDAVIKDGAVDMLFKYNMDVINPAYMLVMVFYFGVRAFEKLGNKG